MPDRTKIFFDTEFIEDGKTIDLLSIGMVRDDGGELYLENCQADWRRADPWVRENVIPKLAAWPGDHDRQPHRHALIEGWHFRDEIAASVKDFVGPAPEFWAYYADYDWVVLCQLYGRMIDLPQGWPMYCRDFKQLIGEGTSIPKLAEDEAHNALADARWLRNSYDAFYRPSRRTY